MTDDPRRFRTRPDAAPGSYCLAVCYCGDCPGYRPLPPPAPIAPTNTGDGRQAAAWADREEPTWLDKD